MNDVETLPLSLSASRLMEKQVERGARHPRQQGEHFAEKWERQRSQMILSAITYVSCPYLGKVTPAPRPRKRDKG